MENDILLKRIEALEKEIKELKKENLNMFGRSYNQVGSSSSDLLLKTKGLIKIQWGNKFIDLIKEGKLNVNSEFIFKQDSIGTKDGIYLIKDKVFLVVSGTQIQLDNGEGTSYISFLYPQNTTSENKYTALTNIGFIYPNLSSVNENSLLNGIIYIESEQKLYIINNGELKEYNIEIPNSINGSFIIENGSLYIKGEGTSNSISFTDLLIYNNVISTKNKLTLIAESILISGNVQCNNDIVTNCIKSKDFSNNYGFQLKSENGISTLYIDKIIKRTKETSSEIIYANSENFITNISDNYVYFDKDCEIGDSFYVSSRLIVFTILTKELEEDKFKYTIYIDDNLLDLLNIDNEEILVLLKNLTCYKNDKLLRIKNGNFDVLTFNSDLSENIFIRIGSNLESLQGNINLISSIEINSNIGNIDNISSEILNSKEATFEKLQTQELVLNNLECDSIINNEELELEENSNKVATTKWVKQLLDNIILT